MQLRDAPGRDAGELQRPGAGRLGPGEVRNSFVSSVVSKKYADLIHCD